MALGRRFRLQDSGTFGLRDSGFSVYRETWRSCVPRWQGSKGVWGESESNEAGHGFALRGF